MQEPGPSILPQFYACFDATCGTSGLPPVFLVASLPHGYATAFHPAHSDENSIAGNPRG